MNCSNCGTANEPGRKFCRECGERLGMRCPACGTVESGQSKFCGECGTALAPSTLPALATSPPAEDDAAVSERRLVSVLFADLVGFTTLAETRDPEAVRELLTDYYEQAREVVSRYRGSIDKFIGDAVMAIWGAPVAREDDAERAVRCALDLVQTVHGLRDRAGIPQLTARVGVHTGEAAVSVGARGQGLVAGDIVNTASRLQSTAEPGTVVVGEATQRAASRSIAFRRLPDQLLKGKAEPVPAWQATHLAALAGGEGRSRMRGPEPPFVGRSDEIRLLKELYHATTRERRARLVSIMGVAGIGKTRLTWELEKYVTGLADESRWFQGRSPSYEEGVSYWALAEIVRRAAGVVEDEEPTTSRLKLEELLARDIPDEADRNWLEPRLGALLGTEPIPEGDRGELFAAWRLFFESVARRAPVVLVFEDLHWADGGMLDFIESLLQWSRAFPIFVMTLARPELLERRPTWGAGQRSFNSLHLDPLSHEEMAELLDGLAPGLPESIVRQVVQRAEGVPLYAVETVRMLTDRGFLEPTADGYRVAREPTRLALPETLHALIAARLDALTPPERRILQDASVLGLSFHREALRAIWSGPARADVDDLVATLVAKELLRLESDPRSPERGQVGFVQSAIREVVYGTLARDERRARHVLVADYFAGLGDEEAVGVVASHYLAAYHAAPDHPGAAALRDRSRQFLVAAAERAQALHSYDQTMSYLEEALAVTDNPAEQAMLRERAGSVARAAEDADAAQRYLPDAIAWYRSQGDAAAVARVTAMLSTALIDGVRTQQAIDLIQQTMREVDLESHPGAVPLMANVARAHMIRAEWQAAIEWSDRAITAGERFDDVPSVVEALINRAGGVEGLGRPREAQALLRGAKALADRHGLSVSGLRAASNLASVESEDWPREALEAYESGLTLAHTLGELGYVSGFRFALLELRLVLGEWTSVLDEIHAMEEEVLLPHEWEHLFDSLAIVAAFQGDAARAQELLGRWKSDPQKTVSRHEAAHQHAVGVVALALGDYREAHERAATAATSPPLRQQGEFLAGRAAFWLSDAEKLGAAVTAFESPGVHTRLRKAQHATLLAGMTALAGRDATALYEDATARWAQLEIPLELGLALLERAAHDTSAPDDALVQARDVLAGLGAEGVVERLCNSVVTKP